MLYGRYKCPIVQQNVVIELILCSQFDAVHSSLMNSVVATHNKSIGREMVGLSVVKDILSDFLHPSKTDDVQHGVLELLISLLLQ